MLFGPILKHKYAFKITAHHRGHEFKSQTGLNFFQALFSLLLKLCTLLRRSLLWQNTAKESWIHRRTRKSDRKKKMFFSMLLKHRFGYNATSHGRATFTCTWIKVIFVVMYTTWAVVKIRPEKNSSLFGIWTHDLCDTGAALYQLS